MGLRKGAVLPCAHCVPTPEWSPWTPTTDPLGSLKKLRGSAQQVTSQDNQSMPSPFHLCSSRGVSHTRSGLCQEKCVVTISNTSISHTQATGPHPSLSFFLIYLFLCICIIHAYFYVWGKRVGTHVFVHGGQRLMSRVIFNFPSIFFNKSRSLNQTQSLIV